MPVNLSWSAVAGQESGDGRDMSLIAAQWAPGVDVRLSCPVQRTTGPVRVLVGLLIERGSPVDFDIAPVESGPDRATTF